MEAVTRRQVLGSIGAVGVGTLAGCNQSGEGSDCGLRGTAAEEPTVQVEGESLVGDPFLVRLAGFQSNTDVTLTYSAVDGKDTEFELESTLTTDNSGTVETDACSPGRSRMMLDELSPKADDGQDIFVAGSKQVFPIDITASVDDKQVASAQAERRYRDLGIAETTLRVADDGIAGRYFKPPGDGPFPGVVTLHGSGANRTDRESQLLATQGYASLALQYFGTAGVPAQLIDVPLSYFQDGIEWLLDRPAVRSEGVGLVGVSRGVEPALFAAADYDGPTAVVGYAGSGIAYSSPDALNWASPWTRNGEPLLTDERYRRLFRVDYDCGGSSCDYTDPSQACEWVNCMYETMADRAPDALDMAMPAVENIDGPVLLHTGKADEIWAAPRWSELLIARFDAADFENDYAHHVYSGAGHIITLPYWPYQSLSDDRFGGTPTANNRAAITAWPRTLDHLDQGLR
ncbi:BAAT/Acyl-CoA thioester hydrolase [Halorhabdus utahensis DSM 12940]|uniref:BAAT/Acyl-CoA thioester hydrolase n=1 Tax=Halorhabdus utahensis (strain DSM 12940 / JCM 11049 / AX-2) TaxID=519442 RepID=C7NRV1_HALUD|nr:acyl-CoA thioester hydrolase/BAAT C-terminal domain-containing protein [Halorhabdus utahensis]ACV13056.1 BAAT/Acyl-CoA thioester hydrolase [Halorhabdus utahensis DSM 12940]